MANEKSIVDYEAMSRAAVALDTTAANLQTINKKMVGTTQHLASGWSGEARTKYHEVLNQWEGKFNDIIRKLQDLHEALVGNRDLNIKHEQENNPLINSIQNQLTSF